MYNIFFGGEDDSNDSKVDIVVSDNPEIIETVKEKMNNIDIELHDSISKAKNEYDKLKEEVVIKIEKNKNTEEYPQEDQFSSSDDKYSDIEDKW